MNTYRLGMYEKATPLTLDWKERLTLTQECGFDWLEISIDETDDRLSRLWNHEEALAIRRAQQDTGVRIRTMCLSAHRKYPLGASDPAVREKSLDILRRALEFSQLQGIRIIQLAGYDVYYEPSTEETRAWFLEGLHKICDEAAANGVILGFETMETPFLDTVGKAMHYVHAVNSPYLQVYPDVGNLTNAALLTQSSVTEDMELGRGHLAAVHLKETLPGIYRDLSFGEGHVRFPEVVAKAWALGVRQFTGEFWCGASPRYREEAARSAVFLRACLDAVAHGQAIQ